MAGARRRGILSEVLVSLGVVMLTASGLLAAFFLKTHANQIERLRGLLGRALVAEAQQPLFAGEASSPDVRWWLVLPDDQVIEKSAEAGSIDPESLALATEAREASEPLLRTGPPWEPLRFGVRLGAGRDVAVARLPAAVPRAAVLLLVLADVMVFGALGAYLMRRGVIGPLQRLAEAARETGAGGAGQRVPVEGVGEVAELARAFNEMGEALERRTGALEKAVGDLRDANETLRRARDGLDRAERLAAVGRLAAGVAHEVGNPMGAMLAFMDLAAREPDLSERGVELLGRAAAEGERVRRILRQLLDFSRPPRAQSEPVDLAERARHAVELVGAQRRYAGIAFAVEAEPGVPPVASDPGMLTQIALNLLLNAGDAVRERPDPRVTVRVRRVPLSVREGEGRSAAAARAALDAVECEISDNGPGVAPEDRERIFDPFYTTKPSGEGTGLGLANAQRLAEELGGTLECVDAPDGTGAAFRLRLPLRSDLRSADEDETRAPRIRGG